MIAAVGIRWARRSPSFAGSPRASPRRCVRPRSRFRRGRQGEHRRNVRRDERVTAGRIVVFDERSLVHARASLESITLPTSSGDPPPTATMSSAPPRGTHVRLRRRSFRLGSDDPANVVTESPALRSDSSIGPSSPVRRPLVGHHERLRDPEPLGLVTGLLRRTSAEHDPCGNDQIDSFVIGRLYYSIGPVVPRRSEDDRARDAS